MELISVHLVLPLNLHTVYILHIHINFRTVYIHINFDTVYILHINLTEP